MKIFSQFNYTKRPYEIRNKYNNFKIIETTTRNTKAYKEISDGEPRQEVEAGVDGKSVDIEKDEVLAFSKLKDSKFDCKCYQRLSLVEHQQGITSL